MDLVIDIGNTLAKLAVFDSEMEVLHKNAVSIVDLAKELDTIEIKFPAIEWCILSSVGALSPTEVERLGKRYVLLQLTSELPVAFINRYESPKTLGVDRIALVSAAYEQYPKTSVLVVDLGTCITYDIIDADGVYYGGAISPGIKMRYQSMHTFTDKLPLLVPSKQVHLTGVNTNQSMHSGVLLGVAYEIEGYINAYRKDYPDLTVVLTGGDADFLHDNIKNDIFVHTNLLLEGLLYILKYNKDIS